MSKYTTMTTKKSLINPKKLPYYIAMTLLTAGASLILGFLSFGGMYALLPALPLAFAAFALSVAYEGEIYLQNIKGAFNKLFKRNYLKNYLAREYLLEQFPKNTQDEICPEFFKDYEKQLHLLNTFGHKTLTAESKKQKKIVETTLADMEKWFALQLFATDDKEEVSPYTQELRAWLAKNQQAKWQARFAAQKTKFHIAKAFSLLAASFMGLGSTYLIVETFTAIPLMAALPFAFWPFIIIPMAVIAGAAYGMLTYNTVTDLIKNDTINKWYEKIRADLSQKLTFRGLFIATMAVLLVVLAIALTICTAGTWWTVATKARPLFEGMKKIPSFVMGVINPIITGFSAIFFNIENTAASLKMLDDATHSKTNLFKLIFKSLVEAVTHIRNTENWLQILNPFRIILKLTITPLRLLLFIGHLISIALTADRMPGVPQIVSALIAIISEGFEDAHYFIPHSHGPGHCCGGHHVKSTDTLLKARLGDTAGHNHDADIPTKILKILAMPLYALAAGWDFLASKLNKPQTPNKPLTIIESLSKQLGLPAQPKLTPLTFVQAWKKQLGIPVKKKEVDVLLTTEAEKLPSSAWKTEHTISLIEKFEETHLNKALVKSTLIESKTKVLTKLKENVRAHPDAIQEQIDLAGQNGALNTHRLFASKEKTCTQTFIDGLAERVRAAG